MVGWSISTDAKYMKTKILTFEKMPGHKKYMPSSITKFSGRGNCSFQEQFWEKSDDVPIKY